MAQRVLVTGATSAMILETLRGLSQRNAEFVLVARNQEKLAALQQDLRTRGAGKVEIVESDLGDPRAQAELWRAAKDRLGGIDLLLIAQGVLVDQEACNQGDVEAFLTSFEVNFSSIAALCLIAGQDFEKERHGTIAVITSVAGDRGRQSNFVYGSGKGALQIFLSGLRNRLHRSHVAVIDIRPGFVDTPMTAGMKKGPLFASAEQVGDKILKVIDGGADIAYVPGFWRYIMFIIRSIPELVFKRLSL